MFDFNKKRFLQDKFSLISFIIILLIFVLIPLQMMTNNLDDIPNIIDSNILSIYFINIIFLSVLTYIITAKFKNFFNNKYLIFLLTLFLVWLILNGIIFPSIGSKSDFWEQYTSFFRLRYVLIFKLIISLILTFIILRVNLLKNNFIKFIFFYLIVSFGINLYIFSNNFLSLNKNNQDVLNKFKIGKNNLLVISFDGINGSVIADLLNTEKNKDFFKDFTLYSNYVVSFPATLHSISSELTNKTDLRQIKNDDLIINQNNKSLNNIFTYGTFNKIFNGKNKIYNGSYYSDSRTFKLNTFIQSILFPSTSRWATIETYYFLRNKTNTAVYDYILNFLSFNYFSNNKKIFNDYHRISELELHEIFNKKNYTELKSNNAYFFHFKFSHWHIVFDEDCNYIPMHDSKGKINNLQNYQGNIKNTKCVLKKIISIINSFRENEIYDDNTIVFKSDHGKPLGYHNNEIYNLKINNNIRWSVGRYNSFFMIKEKNIKNNNLKIIEKSIGSSFLYNFYCNNFPIKIVCKIKDIDTVFIPINSTAFQNLKEFKKIYIKDFISLNF